MSEREIFARNLIQEELAKIAVYDGRFNELDERLNSMDESIKVVMARPTYTSNFETLDERLGRIEANTPFDYRSDIADIKGKIAEIQSTMNTYDDNFLHIDNELDYMITKQVSNLKSIKNNAKMNTNKIINALS